MKFFVGPKVSHCVVENAGTEKIPLEITPVARNPGVDTLKCFLVWQ
jgi:hypothetical protein